MKKSIVLTMTLLANGATYAVETPTTDAARSFNQSGVITLRAVEPDTPGALESREGLIYSTISALPRVNSAALAEKLQQSKQQGYLRVADDGKASELDIAAENNASSVLPLNRRPLRPLDQVLPHLAFLPVDITSTVLADAQFLGGAPSGAFNSGKYSIVKRLFRTTVFGLVRLTESDYSVGRGAVIFYREWLNQDVNGVPAEFIVTCKRVERCTSSLRWASTRVEYMLESNRALTNQTQIAAFVDVARGMR